MTKFYYKIVYETESRCPWRYREIEVKITADLDEI